MELLETIAYEHGLDLIETTSDRTGYPRDLKYAIIGFETFDEAQELADRYGLTVREFTRRDGWQLWVRGGRMWEEYDLFRHFAEKGVERVWTKADLEEGNCLIETVHSAIMDQPIFDYDTLLGILDNAKEIYDTVNDMDNNDFYVEDVGVFPYTSMDYSYDIKRYIIGVSE